MLTSLVDKLLCPACCREDRPLTAHSFLAGEQGHIRHGVLICSGCSAWFPIEDNLLELVVPSLLDKDEIAGFCARFSGPLNVLGLVERREPSRPAADLAAQLKQRQHFDWYAENSDQDYTAYQNSPFWLAADEVAFKHWTARVEPGCWLLDVGCANGRSAFPFVNRGITVVGFDISKKLVRQAIERARALGATGSTTFFVADGSRLPFRQASVDYVLIYGVLHHLPSPGNVCRDVVRVLKEGGRYFGSENNRSCFRSLFDLLMRWLPLWTEEAGEEPLISRNMLADWLQGQPVRLRYSTSVFLPPHLFNLIGRKGARFLLPATDRLFSWVPGLRHHGGLLVYEVQKEAPDARCLGPVGPGTKHGLPPGRTAGGRAA